jgi:hypothetical protein
MENLKLRKWCCEPSDKYSSTEVRVQHGGTTWLKPSAATSSHFPSLQLQPTQSLPQPWQVQELPLLVPRALFFAPLTSVANNWVGRYWTTSYQDCPHKSSGAHKTTEVGGGSSDSIDISACNRLTCTLESAHRLDLNKLYSYVVMDEAEVTMSRTSGDTFKENYKYMSIKTAFHHWQKADVAVIANAGLTAETTKLLLKRRKDLGRVVLYYNHYKPQDVEWVIVDSLKYMQQDIMQALIKFNSGKPLSKCIRCDIVTNSRKEALAIEKLIKSLDPERSSEHTMVVCRDTKDDPRVKRSIEDPAEWCKLVYLIRSPTVGPAIDCMCGPFAMRTRHKTTPKGGW